MNVDQKSTESSNRVGDSPMGEPSGSQVKILAPSDQQDALSNRGGCLMGLGKLLGLTGSTGSGGDEHSQPRHHLRPVSSCSGRIMTILLADRDPVQDSYRFQMDALFKEYYPLMSLFKDDLVTVPEIWLLLNYKYEVEQARPRPAQKIAGVPYQAEYDADMSDVLNNVRAVRQNFDVPAYLYEFTRSLASKISTEEMAKFAIKGMEWLQDPFYVLESSDHDVVILDPHYIPDRYQEMDGRFSRPLLGRKFLAREIAASQQAMLKPTPYLIEGGNVLADQDFILMGADNFIENWEKFRNEPHHHTFEEMRRQLCLDFGVKNLLIPGLDCIPEDGGDWPGPRMPEGTIPRQHKDLFHLDLFLSLGGYDPVKKKETIFVAQCYEEQDGELVPMPSGRNHCPRSGKGLNQYLDEIAAWFTDLPEYVVAEAEANAPRTRKERRQREAYAQLKHLGFDVVRVPCYFDVNAGEVLVSFVNCHIENYRVKWRREPIRRAYVPYYGKGTGGSAVERSFFLAKTAFEKAGFEVVPVRYGLESKIAKGGSFHCMTKVMQRYPYDSSAISDSSSYQYLPSKEKDTTLKKFSTFWADAWNNFKAGMRFRKSQDEN